MASGRFVDTRTTPQNFRALWDAIHKATDDLTAAQTTIQQQAATIASLQSTQDTHAKQIAQALITAGKATSQTTQSNTGGGGGGDSACADKAKNHDSQYSTVVAVIADLVAHGIDLSGKCGSWAVVNEVVKWLRPSQPDVGLVWKGTGGTNCNGYSIDAIMYRDGVVFDLLIDADNAPPTGASPSWTYGGCRSVDDWRDPV